MPRMNRQPLRKGRSLLLEKLLELFLQMVSHDMSAKEPNRTNSGGSVELGHLSGCLCRHGGEL
jgi:hypothetical protein